MLPEQVWDRADLPAEGMYFGRSAGSAQPLVWAHCGVSEAAAFGGGWAGVRPDLDCGRAVCGSRWASARSPTIRRFLPGAADFGSGPGMKLRIVDATPFQLVYTVDDWKTNETVDSKSVGFPGSFVDIQTEAGQNGDHFHVVLAGGGSLAGPEHHGCDWIEDGARRGEVQAGLPR